MIKGKKFISVTAGLFAILIVAMPAFQVAASEKISSEAKTEMEENVMGTLQQTVKAAEIKETPDEDSDTLASLPKGTAVIVYGEPQDSWCRIECRGVEGYIESDALEQYQAESTENLGQEFQAVEEETLRTIDEYELLQEEKRTSRIWGTVIVVLVIAIFIVGILSALRQNREKEGEEQ